ncbi:SDR family oxidoreductase [Spirochaeta isovalerica]|uniref:3-oxoacyl-[acyl-carrier protein] reductase n=1 Tax=Spirochaeta isovalerica TaxID=150 RepID=A0A841R796_9SPIO|nr:SDR family oxidoreductase [Spirochaeta isovalerica]MBB6479706.1 3-oxoacyl-[acyl-carrier protein] reductase [Spirochaeta isovalerica]
MNVFVTGGSRGIGRGIVLKMIKEGYGCAFTYAGNVEAAEETIRQAKEIRKDCSIISYKMDQSKVSEVESVLENAIKDFGDFGALVNNAAILKDNVLAFMSDEEWDDVIKTNLYGPFYVTRGLLMHFLSNKFGRIISISSLSQGGSSGQANYAASKAGLVALSQTIAREYGPKKITSNVVVVGYVPTDMTKENMNNELSKIWMDYCPTRRVGKPEEIADAVYYLTTENAGFINGEVLHVTGGLTYAP